MTFLVHYRHSWLRRRLPKPPSEAPPANRPSAALRHHHLGTVTQQNGSNGDFNGVGVGMSNGINGNHSYHHSTQQQPFATNQTNSSKFVSSTTELNRHQKLPHIGGVQLNTLVD